MKAFTQHVFKIMLILYVQMCSKVSKVIIGKNFDPLRPKPVKNQKFSKLP